MVIGIIGENCAGKSTLADALRDELGAEIITGKDYLRMAKSESEATALFRRRLTAALTGEHLLYVISEKEQLALLPDGAMRILVTADLATIKARFKARMHGALPRPVELMLERRHGMFDGEPVDLRFVSGADDPAVCRAAVRARLDSTAPSLA